jgi:hypothetical protein
MASSLYGLIDAARDPQLHGLIAASPEHKCLFGGRIDPPLDRVAPYIVRAVPDSPVFTAWREQGWGQSWGILARAPGELDDVRRHFRKFLQAMLPDGQVVLFRFYDPRVWRVYLPTCDAGELMQWFAGIDEFGAEGEDGSGLVRYRLQGGALQIDPPPAA